jgi:ATP-dependent Clp protease adaptor protein ClpS
MKLQHILQPDTETEVLELIDEAIENPRTLILHNDDYNTFDFVINSLIEVCKHDPIQAEQCTYLVHYRGFCEVKNGSVEKLKPMKRELLRRGLNATLEE